MRAVRGYKGHYSVTRNGKVWSHKTQRWLSIQKGKRGKGYMYVQLWKGNHNKAVYVHKIVAQAYIPNPLKKRTVNHKDGNVERNVVSNLEWATHKEQSEHAWRTGLVNNYGERCGSAKLRNMQADEIKTLYLFSPLSQRAIAELYEVNQSHVSRILRGLVRANQHKGIKNATE